MSRPRECRDAARLSRRSGPGPGCRERTLAPVLLVETLRALALPRRLVPLALVLTSLLVAEWLATGSGIAVCLFIMVFLPLDTWIRLIVWMMIGFDLYLFYGMKNLFFDAGFNKLS